MKEFMSKYGWLLGFIMVIVLIEVLEAMWTAAFGPVLFWIFLAVCFYVAGKYLRKN